MGVLAGLPHAEPSAVAQQAFLTKGQLSTLVLGCDSHSFGCGSKPMVPFWGR